MATTPPWGYGLDANTRWLLGHGLDTSSKAPTEPLSPEAWAALTATAERHGLSGLLVDAVASAALPATPAQRAAAGELEMALTRARNDHETRAGTALELLDRAGVEIRLLKGMAVARLEYSDEQLRPTGDVDVLVRAEQIGTAVAALVDAGGQWADPEPTPGWNRHVGKGATVYLPEPRMEVDLHRLLVWGPFGVRVPPAELWLHSRTLTFDGVERRTLGREETLLHACAHQLVLGLTRAREARDVAQVLCNPALDVERLLGLARRWGQEALLATAIVLSEREVALRPDANPLHAWAHGYPVTLRDRLWLRVEAPVGRIHGVEQAAVWWELGRDGSGTSKSAEPAESTEPAARTPRHILLRANLRPDPGTYPRPEDRIKALVKRLASLRRP
jgi:hypothetical protein